MPRVSSVCTRTTTLSDYLSSMCVRLVHAIIASRVCNEYCLQKADDVEANMSTHVCNDVEVYE